MNNLSRFSKIAVCITVCFFLLIQTKAKAQQSNASILWDNYGVPHIYGKTTSSMYYAFGWAQMHNHANLILQLYGVARGRAAEYWGSYFLKQDKMVQEFDLPDLAKKIYDKQHSEYRSYVDAFVKGMNDYVNAHPEAIDNNRRQVLPVTAEDVIAHTVNVISLDFVAGEDIQGSVQELSRGSNALAIAASRSASGNAMLMANPHLPWSGHFTFFEAHLNSPGFEVYGATLVGMPVLAIAFNNYLGWTHTVNPIKASTRYELTLKDDGYLLDGKILPFETREVILHIRQSNGTLKDEKLICKYSKHGPIIGEKGNKAFAVRIAGLDNPYFNEQYHKMAKATNFAEFESAEKMLQMPMFNVVYADKGGNIFYLFGGDAPVKKVGDFNFWEKKVDGTQSKYIWTTNLPYRKLPKLFDPATGFVQNANDAPWLCTYPPVLKKSNYPTYLSPDLWYNQDYREEKAINMIKDNHSISFDDLVGYKLNTSMEVVDRNLDGIIKAGNTSSDSLTKAATSVLSKWDRHTDTASRGAVLFVQFCFAIDGDSITSKPFNINDPLHTPGGVKNLEYVTRKLKLAAALTIKKFGSLDVPWGKVFRFKSNNLDLPANGCFGSLGSYRTIEYRPNQNNTFTAVAGDSYVAITEFGDHPKAMVLLSYGNASQKGSKHINDQLKLMSEKKLRQALLTKTEALKNLEEEEKLIYK